MKQNQRNRFNGRHNNQNTTANRMPKPQLILRNTALESTGPCGKLRGTALQLAEKYTAAAKNFFVQNDDVLGQTCLQYADHYMRLQNIAIANEQAMRPQQKQEVPPQAAASDKPAESALEITTEKAEEAETPKGTSAESTPVAADEAAIEISGEENTPYPQKEDPVHPQNTERKVLRIRPSKKAVKTPPAP